MPEFRRCLITGRRRGEIDRPGGAAFRQHALQVMRDRDTIVRRGPQQRHRRCRTFRRALMQQRHRETQLTA